MKSPTLFAQSLAKNFGVLVLRPLKLLLLWSMALALVACASNATGIPSYKDATGDEFVFHSFKFNATDDSPNVEILDYRYGTTLNPGIRAHPISNAQGKVEQRNSTGGRILRGDTLYVKWKLKDSGKVFEDTVDLKSISPKSIDRQIVYFVVEKDQLYVYLISFDPVKPYLTKEEAQLDDADIRDKPYRSLGYYARNNVLQIYPGRAVIYPYRSTKQ